MKSPASTAERSPRYMGTAVENTAATSATLRIGSAKANDKKQQQITPNLLKIAPTSAIIYSDLL